MMSSFSSIQHNVPQLAAVLQHLCVDAGDAALISQTQLIEIGGCLCPSNAGPLRTRPDARAHVSAKHVSPSGVAQRSPIPERRENREPGPWPSLVSSSLFGWWPLRGLLAGDACRTLPAVAIPTAQTPVPPKPWSCASSPAPAVLCCVVAVACWLSGCLVPRRPIVLQRPSFSGSSVPFPSQIAALRSGRDSEGRLVQPLLSFALPQAFSPSCAPSGCKGHPLVFALFVCSILLPI
jgi:hypothetical protein